MKIKQKKYILKLSQVNVVILKEHQQNVKKNNGIGINHQGLLQEYRDKDIWISHRFQYTHCNLFTSVFHNNFKAGMCISLNHRSNIIKMNGYIKNKIWNIFYIEEGLWQLAFYKLLGVLKAFKHFRNILQKYKFGLSMVYQVAL